MYGHAFGMFDAIPIVMRCITDNCGKHPGRRETSRRDVRTWSVKCQPSGHSLDSSSVPVMTSILDKAKSFLPRSFSEWPMW